MDHLKTGQSPNSMVSLCFCHPCLVATQAQAKARTAFSTWEKVEVSYLGRQVVQGGLAAGQVDAVHFIPLLLNTYSKQLVLQKASPPPHSNDCI